MCSGCAVSAHTIVSTQRRNNVKSSSQPGYSTNTSTLTLCAMRMCVRTVLPQLLCSRLVPKRERFTRDGALRPRVCLCPLSSGVSHWRAGGREGKGRRGRAPVRTACRSGRPPLCSARPAPAATAAAARTAPSTPHCCLQEAHT